MVRETSNSLFSTVRTHTRYKTNCHSSGRSGLSWGQEIPERLSSHHYSLLPKCVCVGGVDRPRETVMFLLEIKIISLNSQTQSISVRMAAAIVIL